MIAEVHKGWIQSSALDRMTLKYCLPMKGDIDCVAGHMVWNKEQGYRWESLTQKKKAWVCVGSESVRGKRGWGQSLRQFGRSSPGHADRKIISYWDLCFPHLKSLQLDLGSPHTALSAHCVPSLYSHWGCMPMPCMRVGLPPMRVSIHKGGSRGKWFHWCECISASSGTYLTWLSGEPEEGADLEWWTGNQQAHSGGHSRMRRTFQKGQKYETSWMFLPMQNILQFTLQQALVSVYRCSTFFPWRHKGPNLYIHSFRNKWITSTMYQSFRSWSIGLWVINMIVVGPVKQIKLRNMKRGCECLLVRTTNLGRRQLS